MKSQSEIIRVVKRLNIQYQNSRNLQAPVYPGFTNAAQKLPAARAIPTIAGPRAGPKTGADLGSKPAPKAQNKSAIEMTVSRINTWTTDMRDGSKVQPGMIPCHGNYELE